MVPRHKEIIVFRYIIYYFVEAWYSFVYVYKIREIWRKIHQLFLMNKISLSPNSVLLTSLQYIYYIIVDQ